MASKLCVDVLCVCKSLVEIRAFPGTSEILPVWSNADGQTQVYGRKVRAYLAWRKADPHILGGFANRDKKMRHGVCSNHQSQFTRYLK